MTEAEIAAINARALANHTTLQEVFDAVIPRHHAGPVPRGINPATDRKLQHFVLQSDKSGQWFDLGAPINPADGKDLIGLVRHMAGGDVNREQAAIALRNFLDRLPEPAPPLLLRTWQPKSSACRRRCAMCPLVAGPDDVAAPLDIAAVNAAALARRGEIVPKLARADGRPTSELRALNPRAPRLRGLYVKLDETGRFFAGTDDSFIEGRGVVDLVAQLAAVDTASAAGFVATLIGDAA